MNKRSLTFSFLCLITIYSHSQSLKSFADSIRIAYHVPELNYAVISSDSIYEIEALGYQRVNSNYAAKISDRFRIGSNTKAITGFIASELVKVGKISWHTEFFDLFPELKAKAVPSYHHLKLIDLLSFRSNLISYTYTNKKPAKNQIRGTEDEQRKQFAIWILRQAPKKSEKELNFSNPGYTLAGMMLEKVSGKSYKELVKELGDQISCDFGFGNPNFIDSLQPWGHNESLIPEPPADNYKLNWLLPAGNVNANISDYCKFVQIQLRGLQGKSDLLSQQEFEYLHYGLPHFAVGWYWEVNEINLKVSHHTGNPGTFMSEVCVIKDIDRAYIIFTNAQSAEATEGISILLQELKKRYGK